MKNESFVTKNLKENSDGESTSLSVQSRAPATGERRAGEKEGEPVRRWLVWERAVCDRPQQQLDPAGGSGVGC